MMGGTTAANSETTSRLVVSSDDDTEDAAGAAASYRRQQLSSSSSSAAFLFESVIATVATAVTVFVLFERYDVADASVFNAALVTLGHHVAKLPLQAYQAYEQVLQANPVTTKAVTSATVYTIGDIVAQFTEQQQQQQQEENGVQGPEESSSNNNFDIDTGRVVRSLVAGGIGHGPLSHVWYHLSEQFFNFVGLTSSSDVGWWSVIPKIAIDQIVWGTIWNSLYLSSVGVMKLAMTPLTNKQSDGLSLSSIKNVLEETKSSIVPLFVDGLKLWPFAHIITYGVIPVEDRLLWVDAVEIIWVAIMATKAAENKTNDGTKTATTTPASSSSSSVTAVAP